MSSVGRYRSTLPAISLVDKLSPTSSTWSEKEDDERVEDGVSSKLKGTKMSKNLSVPKLRLSSDSLQTFGGPSGAMEQEMGGLQGLAEEEDSRYSTKATYRPPQNQYYGSPSPRHLSIYDGHCTPVYGSNGLQPISINVYASPVKSKRSSKSYWTSSDDDSSSSSLEDNAGSGDEESIQERVKRQHRRRKKRSTKKKTKRKNKTKRYHTSIEEFHAIRIQAYVRGFLTRKSMETFVNYDAIAQDVMDGLIEEYMRGEFIPDLLIEIFTHKGKEYAPLSVEEQIVYENFEIIMRRVVQSEIDKVVRATIREFMDDFLKLQSNKRYQDPVLVLTHSLIDSVAEEMVEEAVRESLREMVDDFLFMQQFETILDQYLAPVVDEVVEQALTEHEMETQRDYIFDEVLESMISRVAFDSLDEAQHYILVKTRQAEFREVCQLTERLLDRAILDHMIRCVATSGESVLFHEQINIFMHKQIAAALLKQIMDITEPQLKLQKNKAMLYAFQAITSMTLNDVLNENFFSGLDAYEQQIYEQEQNNEQ